MLVRLPGRKIAPAIPSVKADSASTVFALPNGLSPIACCPASANRLQT